MAIRIWAPFRDWFFWTMAPLSTVVALVLIVSVKFIHSNEVDEQGALDYVVSIEEELGDWCNRATEAGWAAGSNITNETQQASMEIAIEYAKFKKNMWSKVISYRWIDFKNETLKRQFKLMSNIGSDALDHDEILRYTNATNEMQNIYGTAKVPDYKDPKKLLSLTPDLERVLSESNDYDEQEYIWTEWRKQSGAKMPKYFEQYVGFENQAARLNGKNNAYESWITPYDSPNVRQEMMDLWKQIEPLYHQLHAYARKALIKQYPGKMAPDGLIPAHIMGNMWGMYFVFKYNDVLFLNLYR